MYSIFAEQNEEQYLCLSGLPRATGNFVVLFM